LKTNAKIYSLNSNYQHLAHTLEENMTSLRSSLWQGIAAVAMIGAMAIGQASAQTAPAAPAAAPAAPAAAPAATDPMAAPAATDPAAPAADMTTAESNAAAMDAANAAGEETTEVMNPYGLEALWAQGDFIAKGTLVILVIMSFGTWFILVVRLVDQNTLFKHAKTATAGFWSAANLKEGMTKLEPNSAFRAIVEDGLKAAEHHEGKLTDQIALTDWVTMSLQRSTNEVTSSLQKGLAFLAAVASSAPFVGLFGTVWGIYHALVAIGISGQASIDKVAGPVGEALIMTAIGLAVAVPAVLGYNWLVSRNKVCLDTVRNFAADVHAVLISGNKKVAQR
jgi:biopolymer transport protein ExbB